MSLNLRPWFALAGGLLLTASASAQTQQCFTASVPLQPTNWNQTVSIPKFDPNLGTLQQIQFSITGHSVGSARAESLDAAPSNVTLTFQNTITLTRPDLSVIVVAIPQAMFNDTLQAFDGVIDFAGPSGVSHNNLMAMASNGAVSPPPGSDLALFTGVGNIVLPITAVGTSSATGAGNLISQFTSQASADVQVCYLYQPNTPPVFTTACNTTLMSSVGVPFSFQVCAADTDPTDTVTLSLVGTLPAGATVTPPLPASGNPICVTVNWTPGSNQVGTTTFNFLATDTHQRQTQCSVSVLVAECHLLLGLGTGNTPITIFGHLYDTQLHSIRRTFPVTMDDIPGLRLPAGGTVWGQVVMYNPQVFPTNPSQWSKAVRVVMNPDDSISMDWFGTRNGITLRPTTFVNDNNETRVRFRFTIDGM
jgi:hypothetical protein